MSQAFLCRGAKETPGTGQSYYPLISRAAEQLTHNSIGSGQPLENDIECLKLFFGEGWGLLGHSFTILGMPYVTNRV